MMWQFWKKDSGNATASKNNGRKVSKPRELDLVGRHLVQKLKKDPDWVWNLREVVLQREGIKGAFDFRVFDPVMAKQKKVAVTDYPSLDAHPELILYEGWYDKTSNKVECHEKMRAAV